MNYFAIGLFLITLMVPSASGSTFTTPAMGLVLPVPGTEPGPAWAQELNTALQKVDLHNHTAGRGSLIPTSAISINADLSCNAFNITSLRSSLYQSQGAPLSTASDINNVYVVNGDLYYNDALGRTIQITLNGSVNSAPGNISGMGGTTAAVTYNNTTKAFTFTQDSNQTAAIAAGNYSFYQTGTGTYAVTVRSPVLSSSYLLTLPGGLPPATKLMTMDAAGALAAVSDVDNTSLQISSNLLGIKTQGVQQVMLAPRSISTGGGVASTGGVDISPSTGICSMSAGTPTRVCNQLTGLNTAGRPVMMLFVSDGNTAGANIANIAASCYLYLTRDAVAIASYLFTPGGGLPLSFSTVDYGVAGSPGNHAYEAKASCGSGGTLQIAYYNIIVYEL